MMIIHWWMIITQWIHFANLRHIFAGDEKRRLGKHIARNNKAALQGGQARRIIWRGI
jgi:hypothetical protein